MLIKAQRYALFKNEIYFLKERGRLVRVERESVHKRPNIFDMEKINVWEFEVCALRTSRPRSFD